MYLLLLFILEQYRFLEIQESHIFEKEEEILKRCPILQFRPPRYDDSDVEVGHDCAVCQTESIGAAEYVYDLPCGHQFHRWCLRTWLVEMEQAGCPLCRTALTRETYLRSCQAAEEAETPALSSQEQTD